MAASAIESKNVQRYQQRSVSHAGFVDTVVSTDDSGHVKVGPRDSSASPSSSSSVLNANNNKLSPSYAENLSFHPLKSYRTGKISESSMSIMTEAEPIFTSDESPTRRNNNRNFLLDSKPIRASKSTLDLPSITQEDFVSESQYKKEKLRLKLSSSDIVYDEERKRQRGSASASPSPSPSPATTPKSLPDADNTNDGGNGDSHKSRTKKKSLKLKTKLKDKENKGSPLSPGIGKVCAGEIGPAIAVGLNIGSSIVTSNGIPITSEQLLKDANIVPLPVPVLPMTIDPSDSSDTEAVLESELRKELSPISVVVPVPSPLSEAIDSGSEAAVSTVPPVCPVDHSNGKETMNTVIPCNIDQLFTMLFTNSKFYLDFQLSRKTCDINQSDWQLGDRSQKTRQLTITYKNTLVPESRPGLLYAIQSESVNAGIPYADAFAVNCHYCLSKISTTESKLIVISKVIYKKSTWAKTFIEKNSMAALNDFFSHLERALKEECAKMVMIGGITPTSPIVSNLPRRRHPRKKCRAPDIPVSALTRPLVETSIIHPGVRQAAASAATAEVMSETTGESVESSKTMKVILTVLGFLLLLNAFLYYKLSNLETSANTSLMFPPRVQFTGSIPQTHQEWLVLLQQQETLHRSEVHGWHEILGSAIGILHQAEKDLESLKKHISTYGSTNHVVKVAPPIQRESLDMSSANVKKSPQRNMDTPEASEEITVKQAQQENNNNDKNVVSNSE
ncbi:GRAM domain-containing protein 1B [Orchesella cincta]|uniref:GRAM domain-containing protein 1B n=1 Tax=Orchesella cincta TaxID=48709 RepID=A0A1D2MJQ4_ORCCI|nr:GRAM domain-containing protein 1B [Orchesella cincta]